MKKTIASLAILASSNSAVAFMMPPDVNTPPPVLQVACVVAQNYTNDGSKVAGCDEAENNKIEGKKLKQNGCADDQIAIRHYGEVKIDSCLPPGYAQL